MSDNIYLVVGCGSMGKRRISHLLALGEAKILVYDIRGDRVNDALIHFDVTSVDLTLCSSSNLSLAAIFICVPPADHEYYIRWALARNIPFMVEQPILHSLDQLPALFQEVQERRIVCHVSNNHRHSSEVECYKSILDGNTLGKPISFILERGEWLPDWHTYEPYQDYYPSSKKMGGGLDTVCDLDWLRYLFGEVEESFSSCGKHSSLEIDTCDVMQFLFVFSSGVRGAVHNDLLQRPYSASFKLIFEDGHFTHRAKETEVSAYVNSKQQGFSVSIADNQTDWQSMQGKEDFNFVEPMYFRDTGYFLRKLAERDTSTGSLESGIENLRIVHPLVGGI